MPIRWPRARVVPTSTSESGRTRKPSPVSSLSATTSSTAWSLSSRRSNPAGPFPPLAGGLALHSVRQTQVSLLLLLLHGPRSRPDPCQAANLVSPPAPDLRERARVAGPEAHPARRRLHQVRQRLSLA